MKGLPIFLILTVLHLWGGAQSFTGQGGGIPDDGTLATYTIDIQSLPGVAADSVYGLKEVCIDLVHTWDSDLRISLISPSGARALLAGAIGGADDNFTNTCFDDVSTVSIYSGTAPYTGSFRPIDDLGLLNDGGPIQGTWTLEILDTYPFADIGTLNSWNITFGYGPAQAFHLVSSNLPIVVINTGSLAIVDDPKIQASVKVFHHPSGDRNYLTDPPAWEGFAGIELRGSSSQGFPKKSYGLETWDSLNNGINVPLLGMPAEEDWVLLANYSDKTLMRNYLSHTLYASMGHYAARMRFVEVILNSDYKGVYLLGEKVKRDGDRVALASMDPDDNAGDSITGGYLFKVDRPNGSGGDGWTSPIPPLVSVNGQTTSYLYDYPDPTEITPEQKDYLRLYVDSFELALSLPIFQDTTLGWRRFADERSFIDFFILNELSRNVDGYRLSTFLHKDRASRGGKIRIGPPWDYDLAWRNADYCSGWDPVGWAWRFGDVCPGDGWQVPFWWERFLQDSLFVRNLRCRWEELRSNLLSTQGLLGQIDSLGLALDENQDRNFDRWPILGIYVWPNPAPFSTTYQGELDLLKDWLIFRLAWLDYHLPGLCPAAPSAWQAPEPGPVSLFPNPAAERVDIRLPRESGPLNLVLSDPAGRVVLTKSCTHSHQMWLDLSSIPGGYYILSLHSANATIARLPLIHTQP